MCPVTGCCRHSLNGNASRSQEMPRLNLCVWPPVQGAINDCTRSAHALLIPRAIEAPTADYPSCADALPNPADGGRRVGQRHAESPGKSAALCEGTRSREERCAA